MAKAKKSRTKTQKKVAKKKAAKKTVAKKSKVTKKTATRKKVVKKTATKKKVVKKAAKKKAPARKAAPKSPAASKPKAKKTPSSKPRAAKGKSAGAGRSSAGRPKLGKNESALGIRTQHVDFLSYKVEQLKKFYGEILEIDTETRDSDGLSYLLVKTSGSSTVGFMPPHPDMRGERPIPREPTLYFVVKDVDRAYSQLSGKGVAFMGPPEEMPWGFRVLTTTDPEGRTIMLASKVATSGRS